ncbi:hypothetical protein CcaverHIS002_0501290 [Cutaneotrichosporon cavernicola]|uniref:Uncharacterized protein n=1 Tax=Cutaneotrichosporon cavernicola TaxID=279322 RepID=A0AA48L871_9TREE|nr:uncharacterized protein CcaverHIS019_0601300 [Cutaneotrichosporon cavernicola]BEI84728.1 hypothetical protein CcaverHIS002_0501290 [Cutaneotrichosporon cavernicola]BEI93671.1 hypothetical protein CcaverHIS019_0601300 [Cutaneotrichosporon cavernicola]BEJ01448.1 hypothetical protein CcaverHIS631_0601300 [Cutaneotrichosporon cavernicola]BEJ09215.1 hypothetical protein CcaverHIS641_0601300 [Cutaneotrichosporon cavernicola]
MIDAAAFPHLVDAILANASPDALECFRTTSRLFRDRVDALFASRLKHCILSSSNGITVTARNGTYAGIRAPLTQVMRDRCALIRVIEIETSDPAISELTAHMNPACVILPSATGPRTIPIKAHMVLAVYTPGEYPFVITAESVVVEYRPVPDSPAPTCPSRACTAVLDWLPPIKAKEVILNFRQVSELPEAHASQLLRAVAKLIMGGANILMVAADRAFAYDLAVGTREHELPGHAMYALVGHMFAEAHSRVSVPMGPRVATMVNAQVAKALERCKVIPLEEWMAIQKPGGVGV